MTTTQTPAQSATATALLDRYLVAQLAGDRRAVPRVIIAAGLDQGAALCDRYLDQTPARSHLVGGLGR